MGGEGMSDAGHRQNAMAEKRTRTRLRRWSYRLLRLLAAAAIAAILTPFVMTTALTRYIIQRTPYAAFSPTIDSAHLSPWGGLTLRGMALHEAGPHSDAELLDAAEIKVDFSWWGLLHQRITTITAHDLSLHLRPGVTHALTLQTLAAWPPTMDGVELPTIPPPSPTGGNPWWIDQVAADGWLHTGTFANATVLTQTLPFKIELGMQGVRRAPGQSLDIKIGTAAQKQGATTQPADTPSPYPVFPGFHPPPSRAAPSLTATLHIIPTTDGPRRIVIDSLEARDLGILWNAHDLLQRLPATLPLSYKLSSDELILDLALLVFHGSFEPATPDAPSRFQGQGEITAFTPRLWSGDIATRPLLTQLNGQFNFDLPLPPPTPAASPASPGKQGKLAVQLHWDALDVPDSNTHENPKTGVHLGAGSVNLALTDRKLSLHNLTFQACGGSIQATSQINLDQPTDLTGKLTLSNLDLQQALAALPLSSPLRNCALTGHLSAAITLQHPPGRPMQADLTLTPTQLTTTFESLRLLLPQLPDNLKGPVDLHWSMITLSATLTQTPAGRPDYAANLNLAGLTIRTAETAFNPLLLDNLDLKLGGTWQPALPPAQALAKRDFSNLNLDQGTLSTTRMELGKLRVDHLKLNLATKTGLLTASDLAFNAYGGTFAGSARVSLANPSDVAGKFTIKNLDQHQLLAACAPEKVDATGTVSGSAKFAMVTDAGIPVLLPRRTTSTSTTLSGKNAQLSNLLANVDLTADGPGRLMIKDEKVARQIAGALPTGMGEAAGILPDNYSDIVVGQLKNYPYLAGTITLTTDTGYPELHLSYRRPPLTAGEPGFGVKKKIQNQDMLVSYPVQLSSVIFKVQNQTLRELIDRITGLQGIFSPDSPQPAPPR